MPFERLPESVQTLYAELLELSVHAEAEAAVIGAPPGTFVAKGIKGGTYWYLQRMEGDRKRQIYLGRESPALLAWMDEVRESRRGSAADTAQRSKLCGMLTAGGATTESAAVTKVLQLLSDTGVFRMGGLLIGTHAFGIYGNMLGVRFDQHALRTQDVDLAQDRAIGIALSQETALPFFDVRRPSTFFKIRGRELRVDVLTPPVRCLDFLIENPAQAVVVSGGAGALMRVPDPARFALHKLEQTESDMDLRQAGSLLEVLAEDRPGDLLTAWEALSRAPSAAQTVLAAINRLDPPIQERLAGLLPR